jgi:hypothetical protein
MKFSPLEWSPHICTQPIKDSNDGNIEKSDDAEVVSVESSSTSSSPLQRRDSTESFSHVSSSSSTAEEASCFLDDPSISFRALSLQQTESRPVVEVSPVMAPTKRRIVKAIRISHPVSMLREPPQQTPPQQTPPPPQDISPLSISSGLGEYVTTLEVRKQAAFTTTERSPKLRQVSSDTLFSEASWESPPQPNMAKTCPFLPPPVPRLSAMTCWSQAPPTLARSKRQRGGSDLAMGDVSDDAAAGSTASSSPTDRRKKQRLNRNRAMVAQEFDSILSQINLPGSL